MTTLPLAYADICDDGTPVLALWNQPLVQFGTAAPVSSGPPGRAEILMFLRACLGPDGLHYGVGKGNTTGQAWLVREDGRAISLGLTYGNACCAMATVNGVFYVVTQTGASAYTTSQVNTDLMLVQVTKTGTMPATSQGFSDLNFFDPWNTPTLNDNATVTVEGYACRYSCVRTPFTVAQAPGELGAQIVITDGRTLGTLAEVVCYWPHQSPNGAYWICQGDTAVYTGAMAAAIPPLVVPIPPIVLPTFAPSAACRWTMTAGRSPSPEDPNNKFRLTTLSETPAQHTDPRNRGVYLEKTESITAAMALCHTLGLACVVRNYDGVTAALMPTAQALWASDADEVHAAGLIYLPCMEAYPTSAALVPWFVQWLTFVGLPCALWYPYYLQWSPIGTSWTLQTALDTQGSDWALANGLCVFALRFCYEVVSNGAIVDGVLSSPAFVASAARMDAAATGPDIKPNPPQASWNPLALALISKGAL